MLDKTVIAVDAMGGDHSPKKILDGIEISLKENKNLFFKIFGVKDELEKFILNKSLIKNNSEIINVKEFIKDSESPLSAAKKGNSTSMWQAIDSLNNNSSQIVLSAGNTGALLILSKMILEMIEGIDKPALAGLWPNKKGMNIVLDLGASIECSAKNFIDFSLMGSALYKSLFPENDPKVAILNVGSEEIKGHEIIKNAYKILKTSNKYNFAFEGYIEGNNIMDGKINVIVTDGFTGNIALKTAEGTANFITNSLKESFNENLLSRFLGLLNYRALKKFKNRLDPRKYNGAIFLGLNGPVVKSHGSTDALGFSHSIKMCTRIVKGDLIKKIKNNLNK